MLRSFPPLFFQELSSNPKFIVENFARTDIRQGGLGEKMHFHIYSIYFTAKSCNDFACTSVVRYDEVMLMFPSVRYCHCADPGSFCMYFFLLYIEIPCQRLDSQYIPAHWHQHSHCVQTASCNNSLILQRLLLLSDAENVSEQSLCTAEVCVCGCVCVCVCSFRCTL